MENELFLSFEVMNKKNDVGKEDSDYRRDLSYDYRINKTCYKLPVLLILLAKNFPREQWNS